MNFVRYRAGAAGKQRYSFPNLLLFAEPDIFIQQIGFGHNVRNFQPIRIYL